jgi:hypothetical protein
VDFLHVKLGIKGVETAPPKSGPIPRTAYDSGKRGGTAKDGNELMKEFDLKEATPIEVELNKDSTFNVEPGRPEVNL